MTKVGQKIPSKCGEVESEECEIDQHQQGNKEEMQYQNKYTKLTICYILTLTLYNAFSWSVGMVDFPNFCRSPLQFSRFVESQNFACLPKLAFTFEGQHEISKSLPYATMGICKQSIF